MNNNVLHETYLALTPEGRAKKDRRLRQMAMEMKCAKINYDRKAEWVKAK